MPRTKRKLGVEDHGAGATLPELPADIWRQIAKDIGNHSVEAASALRLVTKWFAKILVRTQIWTAYDELMNRRSQARNAALLEDANNPALSRETRSRNRWVSHAEDRGDLMMHKNYILLCRMNMSVSICRMGLATVREVHEDFGVSILDR